METNPEKVKITLDGNECWVDKGLTILEAARLNNIHIPTLCHHPALSPWGGCRLCLVEVDGSPRLAASCVTPVRDGMEVVTSNEKIIESRRLILEFLFAERNHNCMFCPQSGDCELQDLAYELQMDHLSVFSAFEEFPIDLTNDYMALDHNRCILCGRCVRACAEITGARVLDFANRGPKTLICFDLDETREYSTCFKCGVCMEVCPTGAISNRLRTYSAVKGHDRSSWIKVDSVCPICGLLCPITATVCDNILLKIESTTLGDINRADRGQLCCRGRFEVLETRGDRLTAPMMKDDAGGWIKTDWDKALGLIAEKINHIRKVYGGNSIFGLASSMSSNQNLELFKKVMVQGWDAGYVDTFDGDCYRAILKAQKETALDANEASVESIAEADLALVIGTHSFLNHPIVPAMIHNRVMNKEMQVIVVGLGDFHLPHVHYHLPVGDAGIAAAVRAVLIKALGLISPPVSSHELEGLLETAKGAGTDDILKQQGLDMETEAFDQAVQAFALAANPLIIIGGGGSGSQCLSGLSDAIRLAFAKKSGSDRYPLIILKPFGNSAGAWKLGISSPNAATAQKDWKAGLVMAADGETPGRVVQDHLEGLDFLAVFSPFFLDGIWSRKADFMLPMPLWMEEDGLFTSMDGRIVLDKKRVLNAPDGVMGSGELLMALAEEAGLDLSY